MRCVVASPTSARSIASSRSSHVSSSILRPRRPENTPEKAARVRPSRSRRRGFGPTGSTRSCSSSSVVATGVRSGTSNCGASSTSRSAIVSSTDGAVAVPPRGAAGSPGATGESRSPRCAKRSARPPSTSTTTTASTITRTITPRRLPRGAEGQAGGTRPDVRGGRTSDCRVRFIPGVAEGCKSLRSLQRTRRSRFRSPVEAAPVGASAPRPARVPVRATPLRVRGRGCAGSPLDSTHPEPSTRRRARPRPPSCASGARR